MKTVGGMSQRVLQPGLNPGAPQGEGSTPHPSAPVVGADRKDGVVTKIQERRTAAREQLESAVRELMTSEGWVRWMRSRAQFHSYSFNNTLLIAMQRPDATQVAGYKTWQKLGRQVLKGEKSIKIFAPMPITVRDDAGEPVFDETGKPVRRMAFKVVSVFDIAQTDGEPLPEIPEVSIEGDEFADRLPELEGFAESIGCSVTYRELPGDVGGYHDPSTKEVVVEARTSGNRKVRTLVHEIAHALGVGYREYTRQDAEVIVESVSWIVCQGIGLDTSGEALPYIAGWGGASDLEAMRKFAETVDKVATKIEGVLMAPSNTREELAA